MDQSALGQGESDTTFLVPPTMHALLSQWETGEEIIGAEIMGADEEFDGEDTGLDEERESPAQHAGANEEESNETNDVPMAQLFGLHPAEEWRSSSSSSVAEGEHVGSASTSDGEKAEGDASVARASSSGALAAHRVKELLRLEGSSGILSKNAVRLVSDAVALIVQDLTRTAGEIAVRRQRKRVTADDIAQAISLYDRFSFLSDVIPQPSHRKSVAQSLLDTEASPSRLRKSAPAAARRPRPPRSADNKTISNTSSKASVGAGTRRGGIARPTVPAAAPPGGLTQRTLRF